MDNELIRSLPYYSDLYIFAGEVPRSEEEILEFLMASGKSVKGAKDTLVRVLTKRFLVPADGADTVYILNRRRAEEELEGMAEMLGISPGHSRQETAPGGMPGKASENEGKKGIPCQETEEEEIRKLKQMIVKEWFQKNVILMESTKAIPQPEPEDGFFYGAGTLNVPDLAEQRLKERPSFYQDEAEGATQVLTEGSYRKALFPEGLLNRILSKREKDLREEQTFEEENHVRQRKREEQLVGQRKRMLTGRLLSIRALLGRKDIPNQGKLALYAFFREYRGEDMEKLLNFAGDNGIDADLLITILENGDSCDSYENVRDLLKQFSKTSEWRMKQSLAEDLIRGKWKICAEYNGEKTVFRLVPEEELNEIRLAVGLPPVRAIKDMEREGERGQALPEKTGNRSAAEKSVPGEGAHAESLLRSYRRTLLEQAGNPPGSTEDPEKEVYPTYLMTDADLENAPDYEQDEELDALVPGDAGGQFL